jgi:hypothetical protein
MIAAALGFLVYATWKAERFYLASLDGMDRALYSARRSAGLTVHCTTPAPRAVRRRRLSASKVT